MSLEKAKIDGVIYDVINYDQYIANPSACGPYTAIDGEDGNIYPVRTKTDNRPGVYPGDVFCYFKKPETDVEKSNYSASNVIDFHDASTLRELILTQQKLMNEERSVLTTIDSVFAPSITEGDTPEMQALKSAIAEKHIDLDKYAPRFGPNFNNDKRLLRKDSITFGKLRTICEALDMDATIILEDSGENVPNPIGKQISMKITGKNVGIDGNEEEQ